MNESKWKKELEELDKLIEEKNLKTDKSHYYTNGYDAPFKMWNRRNEVWRVKAEDWYNFLFFNRGNYDSHFTILPVSIFYIIFLKIT